RGRRLRGRGHDAQGSGPVGPWEPHGRRLRGHEGRSRGSHRRRRTGPGHQEESRVIVRPGSAVEFQSEETSAWGELKLLCGTANPELARLIANDIGVQLTEPGIRRFP